MLSINPGWKFELVDEGRIVARPRVGERQRPETLQKRDPWSTRQRGCVPPRIRSTDDERGEEALAVLFPPELQSCPQRLRCLKPHAPHGTTVGATRENGARNRPSG